MATPSSPHFSVMLPEVLQALAPKAGEVYVDGTMGAGGYSRAMLEAADCTVIGVDRDALAHDMAAEWGRDYGARLKLQRGDFADMAQHIKAAGYDCVDGIVLDLGVSSMQLDRAERGFSFRFDGALDMRMDQRQKITAADIVNNTDEQELADLIYKYGEEHYSRRIARAIVKARAEKPIATTLQLAAIVKSAVPHSPKDKTDPATKTFQALRIAVNDELGAIERVLAGSESCLKEGGRLIVVTFHSLEDRLVKNFMLSKAKAAPSSSRHIPDAGRPAPFLAQFNLLTKKAVQPSSSEVSINPRSRSAKMRAAIRVNVNEKAVA